MGKSRLLDEVAAMARRRRREHPARPGSESGGSEDLGWMHQSPPPAKPGYGRDHRSCLSPAAASSGRLARGAPRLGMPGRMVTVTGPSPSPAARQNLSVLEAVLERITYANEDTGYTIARVATERTGPDLLTVVGPLLGAQVGESLRLTGRWSSHPTYGRQFQVHSYTTGLPATIQGIRRYLGSGLIKGIGPVMAERMVAHFGAGILAVIETEPGRLVEVHGLGPKRAKKIAEAWEEQKAIKEVMVFLSGVGVSTSLAVRIYKKYGSASITIVKNEPYRLASDVRGLGVKTADTLAQAVGLPHDRP